MTAARPPRCIVCTLPLVGPADAVISPLCGACAGTFLDHTDGDDELDAEAQRRVREHVHRAHRVAVANERVLRSLRQR